MNWWSRVSESCELLLQIIHAQEGGFGTSDLYYVGQKQRWQPGLATNIKNGEETLWDWALHLWNLVCYFQMQCQNWVELCCGFGAQLCLTPCDPHGLKHTRLPCSSPTPGACSDSCPSSQWCHPTISSCHSLLLPSIFPSITVFSNKSVLRIK